MTPMLTKAASAARSASEQATGYCPASEIDWEIVTLAVLRAIREPDEAMIEAGQATECEHGDMNCGCAIAWQAMIDKVLEG